MRVKPKVIKVPCGGWVAKGEELRHLVGCELCEAIQELKTEKENTVYIAIFVLIFFGLAGWMGFLIFSVPWWK